MVHSLSPMNGLEQLLGGYVNYDWDHDYPDVWGAVRAFRRLQPREQVDDARSQLESLLASGRSEAELQSVADSMNCGYWPYDMGETYRSFFEGIVRELSDEENARERDVR